MARVGMRHLVCAPITTETTGSAIAYGTGMLMGRAVRGNLQWERNDNPLYGDDVEAESDNGVTGYTLDVGTTELLENVAAAVLGLTAGTGEGHTDEYETTDAAAPYVGCGYIQVLRRKGETKYKALWYHKVQFGIQSEESRTKEKTITWGTPELHGTGFGVYNDNSGKAKFRIEKLCATEAAAITWLNGLAGIT